MYKFSNKSLEKLDSVHPYLVRVLQEAIQIFDISVLEGVRTQERQNKLFEEKKTKTLRSKHLIQDDGYAHAVDIAPYPIDWEDLSRFYYLGGLIKGLSHNGTENIIVRWGGDWNSNGKFDDQKFNDLVHFELREKH